MNRSARLTGFVTSIAFLLTSCGGGGGGSTAAPAPTPTPTPTGFFAVPAAESLSISDVQSIVGHAVAEAQARNLPSAISVVDRVGNVLAVFRMNNAPTLVRTPKPATGIGLDAQDLAVPSEFAAISKAITGSYLSSGGHAFTTRTASQIVQPRFPPAPQTFGLESGPLFGVQFSSLPCSDFNTRFGLPGGGAMIGPKRSPLGLAADAGGLPLYKNGVLVGGIGVSGDQKYDFDPDITDVDNDTEEFIALAGSLGYQAPDLIRADHISVDGTQLRFTDATNAGLMTNGTATYASATATGALVPVRGYFGVPTPAILAGVVFGTEASGVRASRTSEFSNIDAFVFSDGAGNDRYPLRGGTDAGDVSQPLTQAEVTAILEEAFKVLTRARAQIRQPLDSRMQATIAVVDTRGVALGMIRSPDAALFGADVSLQKARTVNFFSGSFAFAQLQGDPSADVRSFGTGTRTFFNDPTALTGAFAFGNRSVGNISQPYFPDGEIGRPNGPLSRPIQQWSPFSTGLQSALIISNLIEHAGFVIGANATDTPQKCTKLPDAPGGTGQKRLANGLQIFPGGVPIYRGNTLVGGIGVSGDGIDQDDMVSFLGVNNGGLRVGTVGNAPLAMRADRLVVDLGNAQVRLRYVNCPFAPFLDTASQNVCEGL